MRSALAIALSATLLIGCLACKADERNEETASDAGIAAPRASDAHVPIVVPEPRSDATPAPQPAPRPPKRELIQIILRSTPPGASASVDGVVVGITPTYWQGEKTFAPREFTFVRPGYAMARYRFVPITGGVVHATLKPVMSDEDAGP